MKVIDKRHGTKPFHLLRNGTTFQVDGSKGEHINMKVSEASYLIIDTGQCFTAPPSISCRVLEVELHIVG